MDQDGDKDKDWYFAQEDLSVMFIVAKRMLTKTKSMKMTV